MRALAVLVAILPLACGDDSSPSFDGPTSSPIDARAGDGSAGADGSLSDAPAASPDASSIDAAPTSCDGLDQETCAAAEGCSPGCIGMCDCTCAGPPGFEGCGCEECPAGCFTYSACVDVSDAIPCGPDYCDPATEICVGRVGGLGILYGCQPVPAGCAEDRTCGCVGETLCTDAFDLCVDTEEQDTVLCECPACV